MNSALEASGDVADLVKVFCVGLHKTSTTSLANALYTLGYHVGGYFDTGQFADDEQLRKYVVQQASLFDAVQDMPWPAFYQLLDEAFPGSKFILTVRDPERWINSVVTHFGDQPIVSHEYVYGVPTAANHEEAYVNHFHRHNEEVRRYFADRPLDLLVMDISTGDGWPELCSFLAVPEPGWSFPRQNDKGERRASRYRRKAASIARSCARRAGLGERWTCADAIRAPEAYESVHVMCRRLDAVVRHLDVTTGERAAGMSCAWLDDLVEWSVDAGAPTDATKIRQALSSWRLADAWRELRPSVRQWTADLRDEGGGVLLPDGRSATAAIRDVLGRGDRYWRLIAPEIGLADGGCRTGGPGGG